MNKLRMLMAILGVLWVVLTGCSEVVDTKSDIALPQSFKSAKQYKIADGYLVVNLPGDTIELDFDWKEDDEVPRDRFRMFRSDKLFSFTIMTESLSPQTFYESFIDEGIVLEQHESPGEIKEMVSRLYHAGDDYLVCKSILMSDEYNGNEKDALLLDYLRDQIVEYGSKSHGVGEVEYLNTRGDRVSMFYVYRLNSLVDGSPNILNYYGFYNNKMAFHGLIASSQLDCVGLDNSTSLIEKIFVAAVDPVESK